MFLKINESFKKPETSSIMATNELDQASVSFLNPQTKSNKSQMLKAHHRSKVDFKLKNFNSINQKYFISKENEKNNYFDAANNASQESNRANKKVSIFESMFSPPSSVDKYESIIKPLRETSSRQSTRSTVKSDEKKPVSVQAKDVLTLERENTNPYFWYFKKTECKRNSCQLKNHALERDKKTSQTRASPEETGLKSILKETGHKKPVDLASCAFSEFKSFYSSNEEKKYRFSKPKKLNEKCENYYKIDQELLNNKYFVQIPKPKTPILAKISSTEPKKAVLKREVDIVKAGKLNILSFAELKKLKIDDRYINEAQSMIFKHEWNSLYCHGIK